MANIYDPQSMFNSYQQSYDQARAANENRYQTIQGGYRDNIARNAAANQALYLGFQNRQNAVMGDINGLGQSQRQALADQYAQMSAHATQDLASRGLANTTVTSAVQRGIGLDQAKAGIALNDALSRERAQYMTQLSGDVLGAQQYANQSDAQLRGGLLNFQERRTDAYPNAQMYAGLIGQAGAFQQAQANALARQGGGYGYGGNRLGGGLGGGLGGIYGGGMIRSPGAVNKGFLYGPSPMGSSMAYGGAAGAYGGFPGGGYPGPGLNFARTQASYGGAGPQLGADYPNLDAGGNVGGYWVGSAPGNADAVWNPPQPSRLGANYPPWVNGYNPEGVP